MELFPKEQIVGVFRAFEKEVLSFTLTLSCLIAMTSSEFPCTGSSFWCSLSRARRPYLAGSHRSHRKESYLMEVGKSSISGPSRKIE